MQVYELIKELKKYDPNTLVVFHSRWRGNEELMTPEGASEIDIVYPEHFSNVDPFWVKEPKDAPKNQKYIEKKAIFIWRT